MSVLKELEPKKVFYYFEEICRIPHGSYDTKRISDYCVNFAKERRLEVFQDHMNNVIVKKPGTKGYENADTVILQGHLDMVCEKTPESSHDFSKDGLELMVEDGFVKAKDTTLGGDDGIAVAMILAVLDSNDIPHPPLEAVFTTDEEVGMGGAHALDMKKLRGRVLINIDSEEEGVLTAGCAGGYRFDTCIPVDYQSLEGMVLTIRIGGLTGGHSGIEIHKQRGNAHILMGRLLNHLAHSVHFRLADIGGGSKDNVIARESMAQIAISSDDKEQCKAQIHDMEKIWKSEFGSDEPELFIAISEAQGEKTFTEESTNRVINYLSAVPNGVICYERQIEGQVETSLNLGIVRMTEEGLVLSHLVRSSLESKKEALKEQLQRLAAFAGGNGKAMDEYPSWNYRADSRLQKLMVSVYRNIYKKNPQIVTIHGGLECGLFVGKRPELDCVSFGPDIFDVHSVNERMDPESVRRSYQYLLEVLKAAEAFI